MLCDGGGQGLTFAPATRPSNQKRLLITEQIVHGLLYGKQVGHGINGIQAIKEAGGWRVTSIMVQAESATAPSPKEYLP